jgi:hypothetical protein
MGGKMKNDVIRRKRAALSIGERAEEVTRGRTVDDSPDALADAVIDFGVTIASEKVANGLKAAGLGLPDGTLSAESIRIALSGKIGADIADLSPDGIADALNRRLSLEVGALLGVDGVDLLGGGDLGSQARALALQAIASGRPSKLVSASLMRELRTSAAFLAAGLSIQDKAAAQNRARQRRFRQSSKQVWV